MLTVDKDNIELGPVINVDKLAVRDQLVIYDTNFGNLLVFNSAEEFPFF